MSAGPSHPSSAVYVNDARPTLVWLVGLFVPGIVLALLAGWRFGRGELFDVVLVAVGVAFAIAVAALVVRGPRVTAR